MLMMNDPQNNDELAIDMNRNHNVSYLMNIQGGDIVLVRNHSTGERMVVMPTIGVSFEHRILTEFPLRFRAFIDALLIRAAEERSRRHIQPKNVKPVSQDHGRQFFMTPKLLANMKCPPNCSICLEDLIPEGMKRKKVWKLGCDCMFHKQCIVKWFKESSRCPNCRKDCSE